jgi:valyl-tRNA synthetase
MSLPKQYEPKRRSNEIYSLWEEGGYFHADPHSKKPSFCIVMPPPNVTGVLHMGHALVSTLQDILIRWKRMSGFEALWIPGVDHAGISTQTVVERHLIRLTGKRRQEFTREEFLDHVWQWKTEKEQTIIQQLKAMGCSCDWQRYRFTMDERSNQAVRSAFKKMFDEGLIYRGDYLVNWDPVTQTALADDEVEYIERTTSLWHVRYPLEDGSGHLIIATTRPEVMFGDTAVAVHPEDDRYRSVVGKKIRLPLANRLIPIVADPFVSREFGTGAVKITPGHDTDDYLLAQRHALPVLNVMTPDGRLNELAGEFQGLSMEDGRGAVAEKLKELGCLHSVQPHHHRIGISYRSKAPIEPYVSKQWFVRMGGFATSLRQVVERGKVQLIPKSWELTYFHWIDHLRDWCISRQLWWGHRIPIWYHRLDPERMICYDGEGLPPEAQSEPDQWYQDPDALDTWFSSGLWPFSTLGWPEQTADLAKFYPNSVLVTAHDILFFWVARMILMGDYLQKEVPFPQTFIHGLIYGRSYWRVDPRGGVIYVSQAERAAYDRGEPLPQEVYSRWEKLSKSKGNVIDPLQLIEEYGTDAMRMGLCASGPQNVQIDLDRRRFEEFKNFTNKIWNGARFVFMNLEEEIDFSAGLNDSLLAIEDRWILSVLNRTIADVNRHLESYAFDHAAMAAYDFYWKEFCAYYVEAVKPVLFGKMGTAEERKNKQRLLAIVLGAAIRLLHPIAPYITEELFSHLSKRLAGYVAGPVSDPYTHDLLTAFSAPACIVAAYPQVIRPADISAAVEADFRAAQELVYTVRNIRAEMGLPPTQETDVYLVGDIPEAHRRLLRALIRIAELKVFEQPPSLPFAAAGAVGEIKIFVPLPRERWAKERERLQKELDRLAGQIEAIRHRLQNEDFVAKAPVAVVQKAREELTRAQEEHGTVAGQLSAWQR